MRESEPKLQIKLFSERSTVPCNPPSADSPGKVALPGDLLCI